MYICVHALILNSITLLRTGFKLSIPPERAFPVSSVRLLTMWKSGKNKSPWCFEEGDLERGTCSAKNDSDVCGYWSILFSSIIYNNVSCGLCVCVCVRAGYHLPPFHIHQALGKKEESIFFSLAICIHQREKGLRFVFKKPTRWAPLILFPLCSCGPLQPIPFNLIRERGLIIWIHPPRC